MPLIRTRGELVFVLVLCSLFNAMGVLFVLKPSPRLPLDPAAYLHHSGRFDQVVSGAVGRSPRLVFRLAGDRQAYETNRPDIVASYRDWRRGSTELSFWTLADAPGNDPERARPALGLSVDGQTKATLDDDIRRHNAIVDSPSAGFAFGIGIGGTLLAGWLWRRRPG